MESVDFSVMGREYSVSVKPEERETLLAAVALVDGRMRELEGRTRAAPETLAVMTALNVAHEMLQHQRGGLDVQGCKRRIRAMGEQIATALAPQEALF